MNNIGNLALALGQYASKNTSFPPATITDENANPLRSWRTEILPFIERDDLYDKIDHKVAWNAPANRAVSSTAFAVFECPSAGDWLSAPGCNYFAVVGPHSAWPEDRGRPLSEITDPKSQTILLIEATNRGESWAEPGDLTFDEAVKILTNEVASDAHPDGPYRDFWYRTLHKAVPGINIAMADGSAHFLARPLPKDIAIALLTVDGGELVSENQLGYYSEPELDRAKVYALWAFVFISLLPTAFLRRRHPEQSPVT